MKNTLVVLIALVSIALSGCFSPHHKNRPLAQLKTEDSLLVKENAYLELRIDSIITWSTKTNSDSLFMEVTKEDFFKIKLLKEKMGDMMDYLHKMQLGVFFVADDVREPVSKNIMFNDIKHPAEYMSMTNFFYGVDTITYISAKAHVLKEKIALFKKTIGMILDSVRRNPADTMWLNIMDTAHDSKTGRLRTWEAANFDGANAAEDYLFFDKLKNETLKMSLPALHLLYESMMDDVESIYEGDGGC
ncbi:MAG TPA: hypothetical protein VNY36_00300 [Bacteroidia bacterium]|jgi:hypothetical protein|nr:hypothetical protein [Bacteroidia bacterium]